VAPDDDIGTEVFFFNPRLTRGTLSRTFRETDKALFVAQVAIVTYLIGKAIYIDCTITKKELPGKRKLRTTASVAAGWTSSAVGVGIGVAFGGFGALPAAVIGETIGLYVGTALAEKFVNRFL